MSISINTTIFCNPQIKEAVEGIARVATRGYLGISRWDNVLKNYRFSGTVLIPIKLGRNLRVFRNPFYFIIEKVNDAESLRIRTVDGEQWSLGDVYGFFGLHDFEDFEYDRPILLVEGFSDWGAVKPYYKYTLACLSAWLNSRQLFFLSGLSRNIFIAWDNDEAGSENSKRSIKKLEELGCKVKRITPVEKDWGVMYESEFGKELLHRQMMKFIELINNI